MPNGLFYDIMKGGNSLREQYMRRDAFYSAHPAVNLAFFLAVTLITAFVLHPVISGISLFAACIYAVWLKGRKALLFGLCAVLPLILLVGLINALFNHAGVTPLFYFRNGNAVTLEAVLYGVNSGCMFAALLYWCYCLTSVMTGDKYVYLFGKIAPTLSLLFSMVLRFVPRLFARIKEVSAAQRSVAPELKKDPVSAIKHGLSVLSVTVTWSLESAVTSSDSMHSRGYGLKGRTAYALYRFDGRDGWLSAVIAASLAVSIAAIALKEIRFRYYPSIAYSGGSPLAWAGYAAFFILCTTPVLLNLKEAIEWRILRSRI